MGIRTVKAKSLTDIAVSDLAGHHGLSGSSGSPFMVDGVTGR
jgi:hypothetical protein